MRKESEIRPFLGIRMTKLRSIWQTLLNLSRINCRYLNQSKRRSQINKMENLLIKYKISHKFNKGMPKLLIGTWIWYGWKKLTIAILKAICFKAKTVIKVIPDSKFHNRKNINWQLMKTKKFKKISRFLRFKKKRKIFLRMTLMNRCQRIWQDNKCSRDSEIMIKGRALKIKMK